MFKEIGKSTTEWAIKNAPTILTAVGAAGVVLTAMSAGKAAIKAKEKLDEMPEDTDIKEKAKVIAPIMARPFFWEQLPCFVYLRQTMSILKEKVQLRLRILYLQRLLRNTNRRLSELSGNPRTKR